MRWLRRHVSTALGTAGLKLHERIGSSAQRRHMPLSDWTRATQPCWRSPAKRSAILTGEYDLSLSLTDQALALNPNSATALQLGGWARLYAGDPDTAMAYFLRGTRLNPIDTKRFILDSGLAYACVMLGRAEEAVGWAKKSLGTAPQWILAAIPLAGGLALLGREDEARVAVKQLLERIPRYQRVARGPHLQTRAGTRRAWRGTHQGRISAHSAAVRQRRAASTQALCSSSPASRISAPCR